MKDVLKIGLITVLAQLALGLVVILIGIAVFSSAPSTPYSFPNKGVEITSIELLSNQKSNSPGKDGRNMVLLRTLTGDEIPAFMEQCYELPTGSNGTPPHTGYGSCVAKIYYANGDIEVFSSSIIELIPAGSEPLGWGPHVFSGKSFDEVFAQYTKPEGNKIGQP